jgi:predicted P-loop ATPase
MTNSSNSIMPQTAQGIKGLLEQALALASKGYPVFPLKPNSKEPSCANGFRDATTDPEQIKRWWSENPNYNIGISAPELLVVDVDDLEQFGAGTKQKLFGDFVPTELPVVWTAGGGYHYYMRVDPDWASEWGIGNNVGLLPGIDLKGCNRGYLVGPGSVVDGRSYELAGGWSVLPPVDELPMLPDLARTAIEQARSKKPTEPTKNGHKTAPLSHQETAPADPELLDRLAETLPTLWQQGRRQELALGIAGMLRKLGFDESDVADLIASVAVQQGDPEIGKRVLAVRDTFSKPIDQIAGLSLLSDDEKQAIEPILRHSQAWSHGETISFEQARILKAVAKHLGWTDARYDVVRHEIEILDRGNWRKLKDGDVSALAFIELPFKVGDVTVWRPVGKERAYDAIAAFACQNEYDPIADLLLNRLPQWDGTDYIALLARCFKHFMPTLPNGADPVESFLRKWLVGAVARALSGAQNFVPVLIGAQGQGKSTFARWIAPDPQLFADDAIDPDSRESIVLAGRVLVHELSELGSVTRRKDVDALKRFLVAQESVVRLPYARTATTIRHRASYIATSNIADDLLRDSSGNRRFVALNIESIDWGYEAIDKLQVWAQAVALFQSGYEFTLSSDEQSYQTTANSRHEAIRQSFAAEALLSIAETMKYFHRQAPLTTAWGETQLAGDSESRISFATNADGVFIVTADFAVGVAERFRVPPERAADELRRLVARVGGDTSARRRRGVARVRGCELSWEQLEALLTYVGGADDER